MNMHEAKIANAPAVFVLMTSSRLKTAISPLPCRSLCLRRHATQRCGGASRRPIAYEANGPFNETGNIPPSPIRPLARLLARGGRLPAGSHCSPSTAISRRGCYLGRCGRAIGTIGETLMTQLGHTTPQ
jgi:hypothetical protein